MLSFSTLKAYWILSVVIFADLISSDALAQEEQAYIIFTADMTEIATADKGGYPELATILNEYRAKKSPTFFVFGGGSIGPSALSSLDRGVHIIDILNSLEPDVMSITKRDFSFLEDELSLRSYEAAFPFVASNIIEKRNKTNLDGLNNSVIIQQGNYKLGVLSILDNVSIEEYGLKRVTIVSPKKVIAKQAKLLRQQGANFVMLVYSGSNIKIDKFLKDGSVDFILYKDGYFKLLKDMKMPTNPR